MKGYLIKLLQVFLSGFFLYAGGVKLLDVPAFVTAIEQYRLISGGIAWVFALWIPWTECLASVMLWIPKLRLASLAILLALLAFFEVVLASAFLRGIDISCGCLGSGFDSSIALAFTRNILLLFIVIGLIFAKPRSE